LSESVAFGAIAEDMAEKKTTETCLPSVIFVDLEKVGPNPPADPTAHPKSTMKKIGIKMIL
jgi:hypothetical protein